MRTRHRSIPERATIVRAFRASRNGRVVTCRLFTGEASHGYHTDGQRVPTAWLEFYVEEAGRRPQRHACRYSGRNRATAEADYRSNLNDARRYGSLEEVSHHD